LLATAGFGWYVRNATNCNLLCGSIGTGIAFLIWMYLLAAIALFGCEFNPECDLRMNAPARADKMNQSVDFEKAG
jgi:membrane protein